MELQRSQQNSSHQHSKKSKPSRRLSTYVWVALYRVYLRKRVKKTRHRIRVLKEWISTEESYNCDISLAVKVIKARMFEKKMINVEESRILCPEFEGMIGLSN